MKRDEFLVTSSRCES